ncbi:MAG: PqqD family protein, partial [Gemmatimonadaceae bacterium]|nr:PqqD family protein [Gemmatimonadaceae bacterium]
ERIVPPVQESTDMDPQTTLDAGRGTAPPLDARLDAVWRVSDDQVSADLSGEVVILGMREGAYFGVDAVAARIWQLLQTPTALRTVRDVIVAEYEVDADTAARDLDAFVAQLAARGLVTRIDAATP